MTASGGFVRRLVPADRKDWCALFSAYTEFYETAVSDEVSEETFKRLVAGDDAMHGLIAVDAATDTPVGFAHLLRHRSTWSPTWYCYLEDLYVDEAARGRGMGRALISAVYQYADDHGCTRTYWVTKSDNAAARSLYDKMARLAPFVQYRR